MNDEDIVDLFESIERHFEALDRWEFPANFVDLVRREEMPGWRIDVLEYRGHSAELLVELCDDDGLPLRGFHLKGHTVFCDYPDGITGIRVPIQIEITDE